MSVWVLESKLLPVASWKPQKLHFSKQVAEKRARELTTSMVEWRAREYVPRNEDFHKQAVKDVAEVLGYSDPSVMPDNVLSRYAVAQREEVLRLKRDD